MSEMEQSVQTKFFLGTTTTSGHKEENIDLSLKTTQPVDVETNKTAQTNKATLSGSRKSESSFPNFLDVNEPGNDSAKKSSISLRIHPGKGVRHINDKQYRVLPLSPIQETNSFWSNVKPKVTIGSLKSKEDGQKLSQQVYRAVIDYSKNGQRLPESRVSVNDSDRESVTNLTLSSKPIIDSKISDKRVASRKTVSSYVIYEPRSGLAKALDAWNRLMHVEKDGRFENEHFQRNTDLGLSNLRKWKKIQIRRSKGASMKTLNSDSPYRNNQEKTSVNVVAEERVETDEIKLIIEHHCGASTRQAMYGTTHCTHSNDASRKVQAGSTSGCDNSANVIFTSKLTNFVTKVETWRTYESHRLNEVQPKVRHSASLPSLVSFLPRNLPKAPTLTVVSMVKSTSYQQHTSQQQQQQPGTQKLTRTKRTPRGHSNIVLQKSPWKPDRRSNYEAVVIYGRSRTLRKTRSQGDFSKMSSNFMVS